MRADPLYLALTRPNMLFGVTFDFCVFNSLGTIVAFLASGQLKFFLLGLPIHGLGYALCKMDPFILGIVRRRLLNVHPIKATRFWGQRTLAPGSVAAMVSGQKASRHQKIAAVERQVSDYLPYARHLDEHTIQCRDQGIFQVLELAGLSFETEDPERLEARKNHLNALWRAIGDPREFLQAEKEGQEVAEACNRLIKNSIVCWNYLYLEHRRAKLSDPEKRQTLIDSVTSHSIATWRHVNMLGEYYFSDEKLKDAFGLRLGLETTEYPTK